MPYKQSKELPKRVRTNLPEKAQTIYRKAYNNASKEYEDPEKRKGGSDQEETAHKVAWAAVKNKYEKNQKGDWETKSDTHESKKQKSKNPTKKSSGNSRKGRGSKGGK